MCAVGFDFSTWFFRKKLEARVVLDRESVAVHRVANPYHAVSVAPGQGACAQSKLLKERRYLSAEAPALPLDLCDATQCTCRYRHHEDRRYHNRREQDQGLPSRDRHSGERRAGRGRRVTDV